MTYIEIMGVMGAGKTSLLKVFNERAQYTPVMETEEQLKRLFFVEPYLQNPEKYGFEGNLNFISFQLNRTQEALQKLRPDENVVVDASVLMQYAYAKNSLPPKDFKLIEALIKRSAEKLPKPDLRIVVYLPPDVHAKRLEQRGRESEKDVSLDFLRASQKAVDEAIRKFGKGVPTLYLDASKYDWVSNEVDKREVLRLAQEKMKEKPRRRWMPSRPKKSL